MLTCPLATARKCHSCVPPPPGRPLSGWKCSARRLSIGVPEDSIRHWKPVVGFSSNRMVTASSIDRSTVVPLACSANRCVGFIFVTTLASEREMLPCLGQAKQSLALCTPWHRRGVAQVLRKLAWPAEIGKTRNSQQRMLEAISVSFECFPRLFRQTRYPRSCRRTRRCSRRSVAFDARSRVNAKPLAGRSALAGGFHRWYHM